MISKWITGVIICGSRPPESHRDCDNSYKCCCMHISARPCHHTRARTDVFGSMSGLPETGQAWSEYTS